MSVPSNLIPVAITGLPNDPAPSDQGFLAYSRAGTTYKVQVADILNYSGVPVTRQVLAGTGLTGGGQLTSNVTLSVAAGGIGPTQLANTGVAAGTYGDASNAVTVGVDAQGRITSITTSPVVISGFVPVTRQVIAGVGLTGGGALTGNVTLSADFSATTPLSVDTTGSAGVANEISRSDHTHPAIDLADDDQVDGLLGLDNGGTGRSLVPVAGSIVYSGADGLYIGSSGTSGQVLVSAGNSGYTWGNVALLSDQPANVFYAGPTAGPDAPVTFRSLVNADLPNSGVAASTYGSATAIPVIAVNAKGVITGVTTQAVTATNIVGGSANQIVFNTAANTTSFIAAPTIASTYLEWNGAAFQWSANPLGTVTSVNLSGGTTGLTTSGGPITTSGTITLAGTLAVANGGTGITSFGAGVATWLGTPSSANLAAAVTDETGSGALVFANSPTLVTPTLGTPASVTLTNATGLPTAGLVDNAVTNEKLRDSGALSVIGRSANSTGNPADISAGANHQVLRRDGSSLGFGAVDLSSNQAVTGTLPVNQGGTGITSFGSGVATWLGTPTSANLAAAVTDETGTGALVFANSPTLVTPALGTPASGVLTNTTGLPLTTGVTGTLPVANGGTGLTSYTANGVVYASGTGTLASSAGLQYSGTYLDIVGNDAATFDALRLRNANTTGGVMTELGFYSYVTSFGGITARGASIGAYTTVVGSSGTAELVFKLTNDITNVVPSERMRLTSTGLGIGTSSPAGKLEVNGLTFVNNTGSSTGRFLIRNSTTGTSAGGLDIQQVGVDASINNASNGYMSFSTNNTERLRLDSSGNLGLGVTPSGNYMLEAGSTTSAASRGFNLMTIAGGRSGGDYARIGYNFRTTTTSSNYLYNLSETASAIEFFLGGFRFFTAPSGTAGDPITFTEAMTLTAAGNWKIGTTSFGTRAVIAGTNTNNNTTVNNTAGLLFLYDTSAAANAGPEILMGCSYDGTNSITGTSIKSYKVSGAGSGADQYEHGLIFKTSVYPTGLREVARINQNGNVGIGTTSPGARLTVSGINDNSLGQLNVRATGAGADAQIVFSTPLNSRGIYLDDSDTNKLKIYTGSGKGVNEVTFDNFGNVGIGTTSPASLLEVQGGLTTAGAIVTLSSKETSTVANDVLGRVNFRAALDAAGGDAILTGASIVALAEGTFSATSNATSLLFQTGSSEAATTKMTLTSEGNLGIGTTSPAAKVHAGGQSTAANNTITGANFLAGTQLSLRERGNSNGISGAPYVGQIVNGPSGDNLEIYTAASKALVFGTAATERARITSDGYLRMASGSGGIQFNGDTAAANALDDYEEGVWTPALTAVSYTPTYVSNVGKYTKVGNKVYISLYISLSASTGGAGNGVTVTGLPFTPASASNADSVAIAVGNLEGIAFGAGELQLNFYVRPSLSDIIGYFVVTSAASNVWVAGDIGASAVIQLSGSYFTA